MIRSARLAYEVAPHLPCNFHSNSFVGPRPAGAFVRAKTSPSQSAPMPSSNPAAQSLLVIDNLPHEKRPESSGWGRGALPAFAPNVTLTLRAPTTSVDAGMWRVRSLRSPGIQLFDGRLGPQTVPYTYAVGSVQRYSCNSVHRISTKER